MVCPLSHVPYRQVPGETRTWMQSCPFYIFPHSKSLNTIFKKRTRGAVSPRSQGVSASSRDAPSVHSRGRVPLGNWHGYRFVHRGTGCALRFRRRCAAISHILLRYSRALRCSDVLLFSFKKTKTKTNLCSPRLWFASFLPRARDARLEGSPRRAPATHAQRASVTLRFTVINLHPRRLPQGLS